MTESVIRASGLGRRFEDASGAGHHVDAVAGATLDVERGDLVAIVGASGSGKSTLLQLIGGLDQPTSGDILVAGVDLSRATEKERTLFRRDHVGFVFQAFHLVPTMSVVENVALSAVVKGAPREVWFDEAVDLLHDLDLFDLLDRRVSTLSGGEQQRIAVARGLFATPDLLLADEPTGNLDSTNSDAVLRLIRRAVDTGASACGVMVTHDLRAALFADRLIAIRDGRIEAELSVPRHLDAVSEEGETDRADRIRDWMATASR